MQRVYSTTKGLSAKLRGGQQEAWLSQISLRPCHQLLSRLGPKSGLGQGSGTCEAHGEVGLSAARQCHQASASHRRVADVGRGRGERGHPRRRYGQSCCVIPVHLHEKTRAGQHPRCGGSAVICTIQVGTACNTRMQQKDTVCEPVTRVNARAVRISEEDAGVTPGRTGPAGTSWSSAAGTARSLLAEAVGRRRRPARVHRS